MTRRSERSPLTRAVFLLWVALLAFGLPEVFAGTGQNWLIRPDVYLLGIPLYALHFLILSHIAVVTGRTTWRALYILGLVFGLYESWITKVIWSGYMDQQGFAMGGLGPWFGIHETVGLVFFFHAITSFLLPLAVLTRLFPAWGAAFPRPDWIFANTGWGRIRRVTLLLIWAAMGAINIGSLPTYLLTWVPLLGLLWLGYRWLDKHGATAEITAATDPRLGKVGLVMALALLALIYAVTYSQLLPERRPPPPIQWITLAFYPILAFLFFASGRARPRAASTRPAKPAHMPWLWLLALFTVGLVAIMAMPLIPGLQAVAGLIGFVLIIPLGAALFILFIIRPLFARFWPGKPA